MSGNMSTQVDSAASAVSAETRSAAARFLQRTGNADLLEMLGLTSNQHRSRFDENGRRLCPACEKPLPSDDRTKCRRAACRLGPTARQVKK